MQLSTLRESQVKKASVEIVVNDHSLFKDDIPLGQSWERVLDLQGIDLGEQVVVGLLSDTFTPLGSKRAAARESVTIRGRSACRCRGSSCSAKWNSPRPILCVSSKRCAQLRQAHAQGVAFGALTADGKTLVSGSWDGTINIWDVATNKVRRHLRALRRTCALAVSPDGETFATATGDRVVRLWETSTATSRTTFTGHKGHVAALAYAPDGKTLASVGDDNLLGGELKLWDLAAGSERFHIEPFAYRLWSVAYAPDGKTVAVTGGERTAQLVDATTGRSADQLPPPLLRPPRRLLSGRQAAGRGLRPGRPGPTP